MLCGAAAAGDPAAAGALRADRGARGLALPSCCAAGAAAGGLAYAAAVRRGRAGGGPRLPHPPGPGPRPGRGAAFCLRAVAGVLRGLLPAQLGLALYLHHLSRRAALALCGRGPRRGAGGGALAGARAGQGLGALPLAAAARARAHPAAGPCGRGLRQPPARLSLGRPARAGGRAARAGGRGLPHREHRLSRPRPRRAPGRTLQPCGGARHAAHRGRDARALRPGAHGAFHLPLLRPRAEHQPLRRGASRRW